MMRNAGLAMTIGGPIILPAQLLRLCGQGQERLAECLHRGGDEPFEMSQTITETGQRLFLRLLGYPAGATGAQSRIILLILEEIESHEEHDTPTGVEARQTVGLGLFAIPHGEG
jgi:hypothetical protein